MIIKNIQPLSYSWEDIKTQKVKGERGFTISKTKEVGETTVRQVEYSKNYVADHWCEKGHILYVINGEINIEHIDGDIHELQKGMTYMIGDNTLKHKATSGKGAIVLIID